VLSDPSTIMTLPALAAALASALVVLAVAIAALRRIAGGVEVARGPLVARQELRIDVAGPVVLHGEGPHLTRRFAGLTFRLADRATGQRVPARRVWMRTTTAGRSRVRLALMRFDLERPGVYRLDVDGLAPTADDAACAVVVTPPSGLGLPLAILATIAAGATAIAALVGIAWACSARAHPSASSRPRRRPRCRRPRRARYRSRVAGASSPLRSTSDPARPTCIG